MSCCKCGGCGDQGGVTYPASSHLPGWPPHPHCLAAHTTRAAVNAVPCTRSLVSLQLPLQDASQEPLVQPMDGAPAYPVPHAAVHVLPLAVALQPSTGKAALSGGAGSDAE